MDQNLYAGTRGGGVYRSTDFLPAPQPTATPFPLVPKEVQGPLGWVTIAVAILIGAGLIHIVKEYIARKRSRRLGTWKFPLNFKDLPEERSEDSNVTEQDDSKD